MAETKNDNIQDVTICNKASEPVGEGLDNLFRQVSRLIDHAHNHVRKAVDMSMVYTYYGVGYYIVNFEQQGQSRAAYGKQTLKELSRRLTEKYGKGWSAETLHEARKLFEIYSVNNFVNSVHKIENIVNTDYEIVESNSVISDYQIQKPEIVHSVDDIPYPKFRALTWSHYLILMRIKNPMERSFYEIECEKQQWTVRQLKRQYNSSLYERLALSRDKEEVMRLANEGMTIEKPQDLLRNPFSLEFLGLKPQAVYTESHLEEAIISRLQDFFLEIGKGFLFEARQKRFVFGEENFYVDLVLYNRLLQCFVLIDLKTDELRHQDLGQMQMYVNYYDRYVRQPFEKPTIGILLCKEKNDALVELTLPEEANIYAQQYALYLPDKQVLQEKLRCWIAEYNESIENNI